MVCRIIQWFSLLSSFLLFTTVRGQVSHPAVEKGQSATLECQLLTATSVTWKMLKGSQGDVELSTCDPFSGACRDTQGLQYQGHITISPGGYTSTLVISSVKTSETQFTCWTDTGSLAANISLNVYAVSHIAVEKGERATLECKLLAATSVTWKVLRGYLGDVELSTCDRTTRVCADTQPVQYHGNIIISGGDYISTLVIFSAKTSETQFKCLTDNGSLAANVSLEVYVVPSTPSCKRTSTLSQDSYIELTCETGNVYPAFYATLHRRELDHIRVVSGACTVFTDSFGTMGDLSGNCVWRIPFSNLLETNTFYVEMGAMVWNKTYVGRIVASADIRATISLPSVKLNGRNCPVGPGVIGEYIMIGTVATCQCDLLSSGQVSGRVRWYTRDGDLVITQTEHGQSSILSFSYSASDANQTYDCRADNPTLAYHHVVYTPKFLNGLAINSRNCPVGPGVVGSYIKTGTSATCKCDIEDQKLLGGQAQWFTADGRKVGEENSTDGSSTLTVAYNTSDPDETYQCRGINLTIGNPPLTYKPKFPSPGCHMILEAEKSTKLECPVPRSINTLTWQVWTGTEYVNVTTCSQKGDCVDQIASVYKGNIITSTEGSKFTLEVTSARVNETQFRCLADGKSLVKICTLELYRWPSSPTGTIDLTKNYLDLTFSTVAYPDVNAFLHRREVDLSADDVDRSNVFCSYSSVSSDPFSDILISCTWRLPLDILFFSNTFYVEMSPHITNDSMVRGSAVVSHGKVVEIGTVDVQLFNCPAGPDVTNKVIRNGTSATCTCTVSTSGFLDGYARWYTAGGRVVGVEDESTGSSILTVSFNGSDPHAIFECRGINPTKQYSKVIYQPEFVSSDHESAVHTTTAHLLLLLIAVSAGLILNAQ
ncbi:hypothetical protein BsWGS_12390 [Bradybaena similaris]